MNWRRPELSVMRQQLGVMIPLAAQKRYFLLTNVDQMGMIPAMIVFVGFSIIGIILSAMVRESPLILTSQV